MTNITQEQLTNMIASTKGIQDQMAEFIHDYCKMNRDASWQKGANVFILLNIQSLQFQISQLMSAIQEATKPDIELETTPLSDNKLTLE